MACKVNSTWKLQTPLPKFHIPSEEVWAGRKKRPPPFTPPAPKEDWDAEITKELSRFELFLGGVCWKRAGISTDGQCLNCLGWKKM